MAGIDHTCIYFHNGQLMKDVSHCDWLETTDKNNDTELTPINEVYLLPFEVSRDGVFIKDDFGHTFSGLTAEFAYDWFHRNKIVNAIKRRKAHKDLKTEGFYELSEKYPDAADYIVRFLKSSEDIDILVYESKDFNVTYYRTKSDNYVVLGGYGHYANPYTHFYHRGYGDQFERKMACECYQWLMEDVFEEVIETVYHWYTLCDKINLTDKLMDEIVKEFQSLFNYKSYWNMTPEERTNRRRTLDYDPESIFSETITYKTKDEVPN